MMTVCACMWLGLFPLLQFGTYSTITYNKWAIMLLLTCFTLICALNRKNPEEESLRDIKKKSNKKRIQEPIKIRSVPMILLALLAGWIVLANLVSTYEPVKWFFGATSRMEGLLTQLCYLGLFFVFSRSEIRRIPVILSAVVGLFVFFHVVVLQRLGVNVFGLYPRGRSFETTPEFQGTIGNIDMDVGYLCLMAGIFMTEIVIFLSSFWRDILCRFCFRRYFGEKYATGSYPRSPLSGLVSVISPRRKARSGRFPTAESFFSSLHSGLSPLRLLLLCLYCFLFILYFLILIFALALTVFLIVTMDVQFGLIALAALALITLLRFIPRSWLKPVLLILLVVVLNVVWYWPGQIGGIWELKEILYNRTQLSFGSNRLGVWLYSLTLARERLLVGSGSDTFYYRFNTFLRQNGLKLPDHQGNLPLPTNFDNPHNEYIAHLINHGLPAMLLFIALILAAVFWRRKTAAEKAAVPKSPADHIRMAFPWITAALCCFITVNFSPSGWLIALMVWFVLIVYVSTADLPTRSVHYFRVLSPWAVAALCYAVQAFFSFSVCLVAPMFWVVLGICTEENNSTK